MAKCDGWCWPAIIYAVLVIISLVLTILQDVDSLMDTQQISQLRLASFIFHIIMGGFWTWLLYWLCSNCYNTAAWVVLFLPFFIGLAILAFGTALITAFFVGRTVKGVVKGAAETGARMVEGYEDYEEDME